MFWEWNRIDCDDKMMSLREGKSSTHKIQINLDKYCIAKALIGAIVLPQKDK